MGRRGPRPAPSAVKRAKGETRPSRVNAAEPELEAPKNLEPPKDLVGPGRAEWIRLAQALSTRGVLTEGDLTIFEEYCRALTDLRRYERRASKTPTAVAIATGLLGAVTRLRGQLRQLAAELGLSPSSPRPPSRHCERFFGRLVTRGQNNFNATSSFERDPFN